MFSKMKSLKNFDSKENTFLNNALGQSTYKNLKARFSRHASLLEMDCFLKPQELILLYGMKIIIYYTMMI